MLSLQLGIRGPAWNMVGAIQDCLMMTIMEATLQVNAGLEKKCISLLSQLGLQGYIWNYSYHTKEEKIII